jgi:HK97 family phage prohead protease
MADTKKPYGDVTYGDPGYLDADGNQASKSGKPGVKRYPLTADKVVAAWSYINQEKNAGQYTPAQLSAIKGRIKAAMTKFGHKVSEDNSSGSGRSEHGMEIERRFTVVSVEARSPEGRPPRIGGYAAKFNIYSRNLGGFVEQVTPSFFNKSRGDGWPDVVARFNHDDSQLLGTTAGRTLDLAVDNVGLLYDVEPPPSMRHVIELVERGDVQKSSFAFRTLEDDWTTTEDGGPLRSLVTGQLVDVAPVVIPAYVDTTAGLRSLAHRFDADLEEVRSLAEAGELRKFFARTDEGAGAVKKPKMFGPSAAAALLARRNDPYI